MSAPSDLLLRPLGAAVLVGLLAGAATPAGAREPYARGQIVTISGQAVDAAGRPIGGLDVFLLASRSKFGLASFKRVEQGEARVQAHTDENGAFRFDWKWDSYYNTFRLQAFIALREPGGRLVEHDVGTLDISDRIRSGSPVAATLEVTRPNFLAAGRAFLASLTTDDLETTYQEMGKPDRVDRLELAHGEEVAWWYFGKGKSYHFLDGHLQQVVDFAPIHAF